jgi:single-strand DNA-binding protein
MGDINCLTLTGRLVRDAELTQKTNGVSICEFTLANNYDRKTGESWTKEANFFDLAIFGKTANALLPFLQKGVLVGIDAELRQNRWEQEGKKRMSNEVIVKKVHLFSTQGKHKEEEQPDNEEYDFQPPLVPTEYPPEEETFITDIY